LNKSILQIGRMKDIHCFNSANTTLFFKVKNILLFGLKGLGALLLFLPIFASAQGENGEMTVFRYENGVVSSEGRMVNGAPEGYWKTYYPSGQLKSEGNRVNHQLDSLWVFYAEDGLITSTIEYEGGKRQGITTTYQDGVVYSRALYENDIKQGFTTYYYPTGEKNREVPFVDGKEEGYGTEYARDGRIITLLTYRDGNLRFAEKVNRYDDQGRKRGPWIEYHSNGEKAMEGTYMAGEKHGIFKTYDRTGKLLTLVKYDNGEPVVDSEQATVLDLRNTYYPDGKVRSTGGYVDGKKEGTHRFYDEEGRIEGGAVYHMGEKVGEGIVDEQGNFQGAWKLYFDTGELKAEGEYEDNKRTGDWVFYYRNGTVEHRGKYFEGLPQGKWLWYFENGNLRRDEFYRRGKEDGSVVEYDVDGRVVAKGEFVSGYKEGEWYYHVGDHVEKGAYRDGERTGEWIHEYPDGQVSFRGEYVAGMPVGRHRWYHPNGQVMKEGNYSSGIRTGSWKKYDENGIRTLTVTYRNGREYKINGRKITLPSEQVMAEEM